MSSQVQQSLNQALWQEKLPDQIPLVTEMDGGKDLKLEGGDVQRPSQRPQHREPRKVLVTSPRTRAAHEVRDFHRSQEFGAISWKEAGERRGSLLTPGARESVGLPGGFEEASAERR